MDKKASEFPIIIVGEILRKNTCRIKSTGRRICSI